MNLKDVELFVFNMVDMRDRSKLPFKDLYMTCQELGLRMVPLLEAADSFGYSTIPELLKLSEGKYPNSKNQREGLVFRSIDQAISFKVINNKYLMKHD
jgi:ATP-dependent RNA circularization protein (DNA/RNA ligase family)